MPEDLVLGIDIGTTSVKIVVLDRETSSDQQLGTWSLDTDAEVTHSRGLLIKASEQDPHRIVLSLQKCIQQIPAEIRSKVKWIAVCGQMHGVVLWKSGDGWVKEAKSGLFLVGTRVSRLITWQDGRCSTEFLASLPQPASHLQLATGFGCATIFWLNQHEPASVEWYDCAGTIQDYIISMLCELPKPLMSSQNAASWGYFNTEENAWNKDIMAEVGFPVHLLPQVVLPGSIAGNLPSDWCGIPEGATITVAMGDLQCSIFSKLHARSAYAVINISTSAQVCFTMPNDFVPPMSSRGEDNLPLAETVEYFPYFDGMYLAVAASLNGGNVLASFVRMLQQWMSAFEVDISTEQIWSHLQKLTAERATLSDLPVFLPTIFGERHQPNKGGSITNITPFNMSVNTVYCGLCQGIAHNLSTMMPVETLKDAKIARILGSGNALVKNKWLLKELEQLYKMPIEMYGDEGTDAAFGAALVTKELK